MGNNKPTTSAKAFQSKALSNISVVEQSPQPVQSRPLTSLSNISSIPHSPQLSQIQPVPSRPLTSLSNISSLLHSPQLSQIPHASTSTAQRKLFGHGARVSSTPFHKNNANPLRELNNFEAIETVNRKRRLNDLFGDIRDIDEMSEIELEYVAKRVKTEEEVDLEMIEKILDARKQHFKVSNPLKYNEADKLRALIDFKKRNLSLTFPKYVIFFVQLEIYGNRIHLF